MRAASLFRSLRSSTGLLCFISLCSCFSMGAFSPLLPEIGRAGALADWQLGVVAGALGFARMAAAIPSGWLAGRYLGTTLCASPALMLAGTVLLAASSSFALLVLGRLILGFAYTLGTVSGLIALLRDDRGPGASVRLNIFEFSAMIGVLGGLGLVGLLPGHWGWHVSLLIASSPLLLILASVPSIRRGFPDASRAPEPRAAWASDAGRGDRMSATLWTMFGVGIVLALAWSAVSQFLLPLRGTREFGLDRGGVSACSCSRRAWTSPRCCPSGGSPTASGAGPSSASSSWCSGWARPPSGSGRTRGSWRAARVSASASRAGCCRSA